MLSVLVMNNENMTRRIKTTLVCAQVLVAWFPFPDKLKICYSSIFCLNLALQLFFFSKQM